MIKLQSSLADFLLKTGVGIHIPDLELDSVHGAFLRQHDWLLHALQGKRFYVPANAKLATRVVGLGSELEPDSQLVHFPIQVIDASSQRYADYDVANYMSILSGLTKARHIVDASWVIPDASREHPIRHANMRGTILPLGVDLPVLDHVITYALVTLPIKGLDPVGTGDGFYANLYITDLSPLSATLLKTANGLYFLDATDMVTKGPAFAQHLGDGSWYSTGQSYSRDEDFVTLRWTNRMYTAGILRYAWESRLVVPLWFVPEASTPFTTGNFASSLCGFVRYEIEASLFDYAPSTLKEAKEVANSNWPIFLSSPFGSPATNASIPESAVDRVRSVNSNFKTAVDSLFTDIRPASLFSTVDAFTNATSYLGTNVLQNLQKIPDLGKTLPKLKEALSIISQIVRKDVSLMTIREVLDLLSTTQLQAAFQWRPYAELVTKYFPDLLQFLAASRYQSSLTIGRGRFDHILSHPSFGIDSVNLVARTKLVMDSSPLRLMSAVMDIDSLGLLPKPSNLFDLVPYSFVFNWFTGASNALRRAEYSLIMSDIPAYYVHSYSLTQRLSDEAMDYIGVDSLERPINNYFIRDLSVFTPKITDSRFGFGIPDKLPPLGTMAALLFQVLFRGH